MRQLKNLNLKDVLFIDIETVRLVKELEIDTPLFESWAYRAKKETNQEVIDSFRNEAALYPEFARIVCITLGKVKGDELILKTYNHPDEKVLLEEFTSDLTSFTDSNSKIKLGGHAIIGFDIPFIMKRCIVNHVELHDLIDTSGMKPWEVSAIDTKDLWRASSFSPSSLINIAIALGLPSPKDDISGAEVGEVYWETGDVARISAYCEKDVLTVANVVRVCRNEDPLTPSTSKSKDAVESNPLIEHLFSGGRYTAEHKNKLVEHITGLSDEEKEKTYILLNSMISTAKGKVTKFTKAHLKELKELC